MWRTNLKVLAVTVVVIGFYTMVARVIPQLQSEVPEALDLGSDVSPEALAAAGEQVFNGAGGCTACHGLGSRAPNLLTDHAGEGPIGARCGSRTGADCKAYLWESLVDPGAYVVAGFDNIMPDMRRQLPEDQLWAVVAFLQSQGGEITVTSADLPAGGGATEGEPASAAAPGGAAFTSTMEPRALIQEKGCLACHVLDGQGGPIGPPFDGIGARIDAARIRRGIVDPGAETAAGFEAFAGTMPPIFGQQLSAAQLEVLVQFLSERR